MGPFFAAGFAAAIGFADLPSFFAGADFALSFTVGTFAATLLADAVLVGADFADDCFAGAGLTAALFAALRFGLGAFPAM
jgi:hypothetical protein